jgi:putative ABC transport system permease protein
MAIRPILSTLARHRIAAGLIVAEVALSFAIVCNALHMMSVRYEVLSKPSGLAEAELVNIDLRALAPIEGADALSDEDLKRLRALPGVKGVAIASQVIYGGNNSTTGVNTEANDQGTRVPASNYSGDEQFVPVHGLKLVAGRNFLPEEVQKSSAFQNSPDGRVPAVIVDRQLAAALFPGQDAVGKSVWAFGGRETQIVGIVETLSHSNPKESPDSGRGARGALIAPLAGNFRNGTYMLRVEPGRQQAVLKEAATIIREVDPRRSVRRGETLLEMRERFYAEDRAMTALLAGVCVALLAVTAFGIVGLASFWVAQRTRMIGIRRALGATQAQIRGYFQLENALLCGLGVLLGLIGALALSQGMLQPQGAPPLPWWYLPVGALLLLGLGQLAVLAPARKASTQPAAIAMRA